MQTYRFTSKCSRLTLSNLCAAKSQTKLLKKRNFTVKRRASVIVSPGKSQKNIKKTKIFGSKIARISTLVKFMNRFLVYFVCNVPSYARNTTITIELHYVTQQISVIEKLCKKVSILSIGMDADSERSAIS